MFLDELKEKAIEIGLEDFDSLISKFNIRMLEKYHSFLVEKNEQGGFFSKPDTEKILTRHFLEPLFHLHKILQKFPINAETKIADVGTGPGIPGFFFSCLKSSPHVTLIDSQIKRLELLRLFTTENFPDLKIEFIFSRIEELPKLKFDFVVMRSVIPYPWSLELVCKIVQVSGYFLPFLAKKNYDESIESTLINFSGFLSEGEILLPELIYFGERRIRLLKKIKSESNGYPRPWDKISKEIKKYNGKNNINQ